MKRIFQTGWLMGGLATIVSAAPATPDLNEVRQILLTNLVNMTDVELDRHAVNGLLLGLRDKAWLVGERTNAATLGIAKSQSLEEGMAYVRVETVNTALAGELNAACRAMDATNQLKGVILDLRFATGDDYAAAVAVVDLFVTEERGLLDWGAGVVKSSAKTKVLDWPVAVLINSETMGAAEALAAVLRETGHGLLLGNATRGSVVMAREFSLANGQRLRVAATPVKLVGETSVSIGRVLPDIVVTTTLAEERNYFSDPYAVAEANLAGTNRVVRRSRTTEADLVRAHRSGNRLDAEALSPREPDAEKPLLRDPALARAVDLLKGLAVVRRVR